VGYRGTRDLVNAVGNLMLDHVPHHGPDHWPLPAASRLAAVAHVPARIPRLRRPGETEAAASA
jgi:nitrogenase molybdenum-iron protein NifN